MSFFSEFQQRRIVPIVGAYVAGTWLLVEISSYIVDRYLLSPYISDIILWGLLSLIPAVFLIAWTHGQPGRDEISRAEKVGIPINIIATTGLLLTLFGSKDLGAAAEGVMITDESGQQEMVYVPKAQYRKRIPLFYWSNQTGNPNLDWWQFFIPDLLDEALTPNPFIVSKSPFGYGAVSMAQALRSEGYSDRPAPLGLQRRLAEDWRADFYVSGEITGTAENPRFELHLYEPDSSGPVETLTTSGADPVAAMEILSERLLDVLDVPEGSARMGEQLSIESMFSRQPDANRQYSRGRLVLAQNNDYVVSEQRFAEALELDPEFALAQIARAIVQANAGQIEAGRTTIQAAMDNSHRLNRYRQSVAKQVFYQITGDMPRQLALLEREVKLQASVSAHVRLATIQMIIGEFADARANFRKALEMDPDNGHILGELAAVYQAMGDSNAALQHLERWIEIDPDAVDAYRRLGDLYRDQGKLEAAEAAYIEASVVAPDSVKPHLRLASLATSQGDWGAARAHIDQAAEVAQTAPDLAQSLQHRISLLVTRGQLREALELTEALRETYSEFAPPIEIVFGVDTMQISLLSELGEYERAEELLADSQNRLEPPFDRFLEIAEALFALEQGDFSRAQRAVDEAREMFNQFGIRAMLPTVDWVEGTISEKQGAYSLAARHFNSAIERSRRSAVEKREAMPTYFAAAARTSILSGRLDEASDYLAEGFALGDGYAVLWVERARLQLARGQNQLAQASINYALALWSDADENYYEYRRARELASRISEAA